LEAVLARKERFRKQRIYKLKILAVSIIALSIVSSGLIAVDINKSNVLYGRPKLELINIQEMGEDIYQLSILNIKYDINIKYLKRDIYRLKNLISNSGNNM